MNKKSLNTHLYYIKLNLIHFAIEFAQMTTVGDFLFFILKDCCETFQNLNLLKIIVVVLIFGSFTQIFIGAKSDHSKNPFGRRRPYIVTGCILFSFFHFLSILFMIIETATRNNNNNNDNISSYTWCFVCFSTISTVFLNYMKVAFRAYMLDEFDSEYQLKVFTWSSMAVSVARFVMTLCLLIGMIIIIGPLLGDSSQEVGFDQSQSLLIFFIVMQCVALILVIVMTIVFCCVAHETPIVDENMIDENENNQDTMKKMKIAIQSSIKNLGSSCKKGIFDFWDTVMMLKNVNLLSLFVAVMFGHLCRYSIILRGEQMVFRVGFHSIGNDGNSLDVSLMTNAFFQFIVSICMIIVSAILFRSKDSKITSWVVFYFVEAFALCSMFFIKIVNDDSKSDALKKFVCSISILPLLYPELTYTHLNRFPYSSLRNIVDQNKFGVSVGFVYLAHIIGKLCAYVSFLVHVEESETSFGEIYEESKDGVINIILITILTGFITMLFRFAKHPTIPNIDEELSTFDEDNTPYSELSSHQDDI